MCAGDQFSKNQRRAGVSFNKINYLDDRGHVLPFTFSIIAPDLPEFKRIVLGFDNRVTSLGAGVLWSNKEREMDELTNIHEFELPSVSPTILVPKYA